jgi:hypothetical protein
MPTLDLPTPEALFDYIAAHLLKQNAKSLTKHPGFSGCAYRGDEQDRRCAVGCVIIDEAYSPQIEGLAAGQRRITQAVMESIGRPLTGMDQEVLARLQSIHDDIPVEDWAERLAFARTELFPQKGT